jgi:cytosine/adenosine deaminase-related metal-dependent hydrolase
VTFANGVIVESAPGALRIDVSDCFVYPGLINAHDHLQLNGIPALPHDAPFADSYEWIHAFEPFMQSSSVAVAVATPAETRYWQGGYKNLLSGVTSVAHHDPFHDTLADPNFPVGVLRGLGWSHSLGLGLPRVDGVPRYGPHLTESFRATPPNRPWVTHLAEGTSGRARTECAELDAMGCLAENTVLVHGVALGERDVQRIIDVGASVVWCPASNLELFGETLSPRKLFDAGRLALGTDSRLTGSRDLLDELRVASSCSDLAPHELLRLVTVDACRAMRHVDRGVLEIGALADCVILKNSGDPYETLLNSGRADIRAVIRNGALCIADDDFHPRFTDDRSDVVSVKVDGRAKLMATRLLNPTAARLEPGLEVS